MSTALQPTSTTRAKPKTALVIFAFALVYIFWGSTYLGISVAVREIPPALMCAARFLAAGSLMLAWCMVAGKRITIDITEAWRLALIGVLLLVGGNTSVAWSEQYTPSGISALIVAIVPLWVMLLERFTRRGERLSQRGLLGLIIGVAGMMVLLWPKVTSGTPGRGELIGAAGLIFASFNWALGSIFARRWRVKCDATVAAGWEMLFAGLTNLAIALVFGQQHRAIWSAQGVGAIAYLVVFGSWVGFTAYIWLLNHVPTTKVATYAYVNPVVAVFLGWLFLHERVDGYVLAGTAVIVAAVALVTTANVKGERTQREQMRAVDEPELPACEQGAD